MNMQKKERVREMLLRPILCSKRMRNIYREEDTIYTGQDYYSTTDEDMSRFAVGFYNILYGDVLSEKGVLNGKYFADCCFAGDTINSFNAIANLVPEAGGSNKQRTVEEKWPEFLREYHKQYHCLANFWVLPMCIGRRSAKLNRYDSADMFLDKIENDYKIIEQHHRYWDRIGDYDKFCKKHFLHGYEPIKAEEVVEMYVKRQPENLIHQAMKFIERRAESISSDPDMCENLYEYFQKLDILK